MTEIFMAEEHSQLYDLWARRGDSNLSICHVDFHCDMRGLLIDRRLEMARYVWQSDPSMNRLESESPRFRFVCGAGSAGHRLHFRNRRSLIGAVHGRANTSCLAVKFFQKLGFHT